MAGTLAITTHVVRRLQQYCTKNIRWVSDSQQQLNLLATSAERAAVPREPQDSSTELVRAAKTAKRVLRVPSFHELRLRLEEGTGHSEVKCLDEVRRSWY